MKKNILSFIIITTLVLCMVGCGSKDNSSGTGNNTATGSNTSSGTNENNNNNDINKTKYTAKQLEENINTSGAMTSRGKLVVFVTNSNPVPVDMNIEVEFYDKDGKIVGSDKDSLSGVGAKADVAVEMYSTPKSFDNYKIYVDVEETDKLTYFDKLELTHNNNGSEIVVQVKNNSEESIEYISVSVVFYQNDKVVGYDDDLESDIKAGRSGNFTLSYPYDNSYNNVKFDTYKVFITEAYSYDW